MENIKQKIQEQANELAEIFGPPKDLKQAIINNEIPRIEFIHVTEKPKGPRPLYKIAGEIFIQWNKVNYAALPYLNALLAMDNVKEDYGHDDGRSIVLYFLSNASSFRGEHAKRLKAELKQHLK